MNTLTLFDPELTFGDNHHPMCKTAFSSSGNIVQCTLDTGFTLGFAFSMDAQKKFKFTNGYLASLMLGNGRVTKGMVFVAELVISRADGNRNCGQVSIVFLDRKGEPLVGIEALRLWSPITFDWGKNTISGAI